VFVAALAIGAVRPALAQHTLHELGQVTILRALDGDTVELGDGRQIRLAGIMAPKSADPGPREGVARLAAQAHAELDRLCAGQTATAYQEELGQDRHARLLAHLMLADGRWVGDAMIEAGLARVFTQPGLVTRARALLLAEAAARTARRAIWAFADYRIVPAHEAGRTVNRFQIVEGRVHDTSRSRDMLYVNFGTDWRSDFTIGLDRAALASFRRAGSHPERWHGRRVRVRGWVLWRNGPFVAATHAEQVELLD
jgi:endonuclease YncB( thermonuclease family)